MVHVGQRLAQERIKKKVTLEEVAKATRIKTTFIKAIEEGNYKILPSSAYAQGFVKKYSEFLGLPTKEILALFRREFNEEKIFKVIPESISKSKEESFTKPYFRERIIAVIIVFLILIGYIIFQYRFAILNPPLTVIFPLEKQIIASQEVLVVGKTSANSTVYINDVPIVVVEDGSFKKKIFVFPGISTIKVKAVNRFGKETLINRIVQVK